MKIYTERIAFTLEPEIKAKAQARAEKNGKNLSYVLREFLAEYGKCETIKEGKREK